MSCPQLFLLLADEQWQLESKNSALKHINFLVSSAGTWQ
jgi:hypothetical protein